MGESSGAPWGNEAFCFVMRLGLVFSVYEVRRSFPVFHQDSKRGMRDFHFTASESPTGELIYSNISVMLAK